MGHARLDPETLGPIRTLFDEGAIGLRSDGELLDRVAGGSREEAERAFAALVERHGPAVLRACRGVLGDDHAAEDAAQATFLVLAKKARSLRAGETIVPWLFGVAVRVAGKMRVAAARRRKHERIGAELREERMPTSPAVDLGPAVHEEVGRLPEKYRAPVVLCYFEGLSHEEAARRLGWPVGTVRGRLARARDRLRPRLTRRGLSPSAGFLALLARRPGQIVVTSKWIHETVAAALRFAAIGPGVAGAVPEALAGPASEIMREMVMFKVRVVGALIFAAALTVGGAAGIAQFGGGIRADPTVQPQDRSGSAREPGVVESAPPEKAEDTIEEGPKMMEAFPGTESSSIGRTERMKGTSDSGESRTRNDPFQGGTASPSMGGGMAGSVGPGISIAEEIAEFEEDDPEGLQALAEVAVHDLALAKVRYEAFSLEITSIPFDPATPTLSDGYVAYLVQRDRYIEALKELVEVRRLMREHGVSPEELPKLPALGPIEDAAGRVYNPNEPIAGPFN